jgi:hypothetical protein
VDADDVVAYVSEKSQDDSQFLGSFRVSVQRYGQRWWRPSLEKLDGVDLPTAVAWARERAPVVLVTIGVDEFFSAGDHNPEPESFPQLPAAAFELKPRRRGASWGGSMPPGVEEPGPVRRLVTRWWFTTTAIAAVEHLARETFNLDELWEEIALGGGLIMAVVVGLVVRGCLEPRDDHGRDLAGP